MKKKLLMLVIAFGIFGTSLSIGPTISCNAATVEANVSDTITEKDPKADIIGWRYKIVDGVLYKRLYNYTLQEWIGDWIRD